VTQAQRSTGGPSLLMERSGPHESLLQGVLPVGSAPHESLLQELLPVGSTPHESLLQALLPASHESILQEVSQEASAFFQRLR
jgi:hypothetical protein